MQVFLKVKFLNFIREAYIFHILTHKCTTLIVRCQKIDFIINHTWGGILFHDGDNNIIYREGPLFEGKNADRYLEGLVCTSRKEQKSAKPGKPLLKTQSMPG
jgi:hypothetical protein